MMSMSNDDYHALTQIHSTLSKITRVPAAPKKLTVLREGFDGGRNTNPFLSLLPSHSSLPSENAVKGTKIKEGSMLHSASYSS